MYAAAARVLFPLLAIGFLTALYAGTPFVPPISEMERGDEKTYAPGADWDRQWEMALVGAEYARRGDIPHWDPYAGGGSPLLANPESFALHPAFRAVAPRSPTAGMQALFATGLVVLLLGLWWLGNLVGIPWPISLLSGLVLIPSYEMHARLGSGHLMIIGLCYWPLALAAALDASRPDVDRPARHRMILGVLSGTTVGLAALGGGHYAGVFALLLILIGLWAQVVSWPARIALLLALTLPALVRTEAAHLPLLALGVAAIVGGVVRARAEALRAVWTGIGVTLGYLVVFGSIAIPALSISRLAGRLRGGAAELQPNPDLILADLWTGGTPQLDTLLYFGPAWVWPALLVGTALLVIRAPGVGIPAAAATAFGLLAATASAPWELVSWFPGMSAVNYPERLQWAVLVFAPLGLAVPLSFLPKGGRWGLATVAVTVVLSAAVVGFVQTENPVGNPNFEGSTWSSGRPTAEGRVTGVTPAAHRHLSHSPVDGQAHPQTELALRFPSPDGNDLVAPGTSLVRSVPRGSDSWPDGEGTAVATLGSWTVTGAPNSLVEVRQRDIWGWDCGGARRPTANLTGAAWLRLQLDGDGTVECTWTSPGYLGGIALQTGAFLGVLALLLMPGLRTSAGVRPDAAQSTHVPD
jgi:hypothetical protein